MRNYFILIIVIALVSCKKDEPAPNLGYSYFPDKIGTYITYEVDSFVQDDDLGPNTDTTYKFQLKEVMRSYFTDNEGRKSIRIERFKKKFNDTIPYSQLPWLLTDVWYATRTSTGLEKVEEDSRYLRLIFPVKEDEDWNGNAFNVYEGWPYEYTSVHQAEVVNALSFDSVATVQQINHSDLVTKKFGLEKYAAGVGLVYKELRLFGTQPEDSFDTPPYNDTISLQAQYWYYPNKGVFYTQKIIGYGTE